MTRYASHVSTLSTPQSQSIPGSLQVANSSGGHSWKVDYWTRLDRFLILGNEGGSYYASERELTLEAAKAVRECHAADPQRTIDRIVDVSVGGKAPKNDPAIFALAMLSHDSRALKAMPSVCRIGTHLFQFVEAASKFRGWGRGLRQAVAAWYTDKEADQVAYQVAKYGQRNGWTHHDVLHKCHAKPLGPWHDAAFRYAKDGSPGDVALFQAIERVKSTESEADVVAAIREHGLTREMLPTKWLNSVAVWAALLDKMPMTAMLRNLGKMGSTGLLKPMSGPCQIVVDRLGNDEALHKARIHPIAVLLAMSVYRSGRGVRGSLSWAPDASITAALDDAYYKAFANVQPTGKRHLLALDVSGSMAWGSIAGTHLTPREGSAAMAMVSVRTEQHCHVVGFTGGRGRWSGYGTSDPLTELVFNRRQSLSEAVSTVSNLPMGPTDCALPMLYALERNLEVDVFVIYTDSETWCGTPHPSQALEHYRRKTGINAKLIVCGMVANDFTIADPNDSGMLDVVGFDASVPQVMREFSAG